MATDEEEALALKFCLDVDNEGKNFALNSILDGFGTVV